MTGACTLAFLALTLTGPLLWWPRRWSRAQLASITRFQRGLGGRARDFNWHNTIGICCFVPLFLIAITGVVISYEWASALLFRLAGEASPPRPAGNPSEARGTRGRDARPETSSLDGLDRRLWTRAQAQVEGWRQHRRAAARSRPGPGDVHHRPWRGHAPRPACAVRAGSDVRRDRALGAVFEPVPRPAVAHVAAPDRYGRGRRRHRPGGGGTRVGGRGGAGLDGARPVVAALPGVVGRRAPAPAAAAARGSIADDGTPRSETRNGHRTRNDRRRQ